MRTLLAISPHLDDAVFSAGALLWKRRQRGWRVIVVTIFTGNVARPSGFALACQLDKGLSADIDYMALRRKEDQNACAVLGLESYHLPLLEAPHRGYESAGEMFDKILLSDDVEREVCAQLASVLLDTRPNVVLAPLSIGGHVDHVIVRSAVEATVDSHRLWLWEDWPYVDRSDSLDRTQARSLRLSEDARMAKNQACAQYKSQLRFQFGGMESLAGRLRLQEKEWFSRSNW